MEFPDAGHDLVTETNGSVEPLPDRPGPRAQFECRRDEFLPRDLMLLHAAGCYTMSRPETALGPRVRPFFQAPEG